MTERTTEMYWGKGSVGDRHWVSGRAYPSVERYSTQKVMDFCVDASAVYSAPAPGSLRQDGESWGVMVKSPSEGEPDHFTVPIPPDLASHDRYDYLAEAIESQLGRTGLMVLVY